MTITKTFRSDVVASVPGRWFRQYQRGWADDLGKMEIGKRLRDLPAGFTAEQVDFIIGNTSWTAHDCDECGRTCDVLVRIGEEPGYESRYVSLCGTCLSVASSLLSSPDEPAVSPTDTSKEGQGKWKSHYSSPFGSALAQPRGSSPPATGGAGTRISELPTRPSSP